jgi:hypothetical protein
MPDTRGRTPYSLTAAPPAQKIKRAPGTTAKIAKTRGHPAARRLRDLGYDQDARGMPCEKEGRCRFWVAAARQMTREGRLGPANDAQQNRHRCPEGLIFGPMKRTIDDLPIVRVATLVARGEIRCDAKTARVRFGDEGVEYQVGVRLRRFRNGGFWAMLVCPRCGGGAQRLRLLDDRPACGKCVRASGLIYRSQSVRTEKRHTVTAPLRLARLHSDRPLRVNPRAGWTIDRRANIEFALRRSLIVARKRDVDRAKDQGL